MTFLTDEFFAKFPSVRFHVGGVTNPRVFKYVDGALKQEVAAPKPNPKRHAAPASAPPPKRCRA